MRKKIICFILVAALLVGGTYLSGYLTQKQKYSGLPLFGNGSSASSGSSALSSPETPSSSGTASEPAAQSEDYRAMWLSYLEWESVDFSTSETFTHDISEMFLNCANLGLNTVIVQVRPFGDALYKSSVFPASHLMTGAQGGDPGYDPLAIMVTTAHALGLRLEAWVNPYRVRLNAEKPAGELSADNPAVRWQSDPATASYVAAVNGGLYYDPGVPEVRALIEDGVREIVQNYEVDGIQFDDYFYPTTDTAFDTGSYAQYGGGAALDEWRRQNVDTLVWEVYSLIKAEKPNVTFGVSPSGNLDNNYTQQYSDVRLWLSTPGYVDYLMPQVYWGFDFTTASGSRDYSFENCVATWCALDRAPSVGLYIGLGAYRIGDGDGSAALSKEWESGENLARMVLSLREQCDGFALYRYDFLYRNTNYDDLATHETAALQQLLKS